MKTVGLILFALSAVLILSGLLLTASSITVTAPEGGEWLKCIKECCRAYQTCFRRCAPEDSGCLFNCEMQLYSCMDQCWARHNPTRSLAMRGGTQGAQISVGAVAALDRHDRTVAVLRC